MASITPQNPFDTPENPAAIQPNSFQAPRANAPASTTRGSLQDNSVRSEASKPPATPPSIRRQNNLGLSELSKQLRALQAKNEGQAVEIDRLERQLRILADLQGISVTDLRRALSDACESEAYAELQSRVAALRAQLEATSVAKQASVEKDAAAHQVVTLELRVGELEEVEQGLRSQIKGLFESLKEQTAKASRFESTCKQQELEIDRLRKALEAAQQEQQSDSLLIPTQQPQPSSLIPEPQQSKDAPLVPAQQQPQATPLTPTPPTDSIVPATAAAQQPSQELVPAPASAIVASAEDMQLLVKSAQLAKVEAQVQQDKFTVSEQQLEATEKQYKLKEAQFKARSMVQEERIQDLEQQMNSLYTAFEMLRQEHSEGEATRAALQTSLNDADSRVAKQVSDNDVARPQHHVHAVPVPASPNYVPRSPPSPPASPSYSYASPVLPPVSRQSISPQSSYRLTPISHHASIASPSTPMGEGSIIMAGVLLVKGSNLLRQWKKKHVTLRQGLNEYQLVISDAAQIKPDKTYLLEMGVSTLHRYATQRYAFIIRVNPIDKEAPVIFAAATSEKDYEQWMSALKLATTGNDYNSHDYDIGFGESHMMPPSSSVDDQEAADIAAAIRLSTQQM